jgi:hypothetical protein
MLLGPVVERAPRSRGGSGVVATATAEPAGPHERHQQRHEAADQ